MKYSTRSPASSVNDMKKQVADSTPSIERGRHLVPRPMSLFSNHRNGIMITAPAAMAIPSADPSGLRAVR